MDIYVAVSNWLLPFVADCDILRMGVEASMNCAMIDKYRDVEFFFRNMARERFAYEAI